MLKIKIFTICVFLLARVLPALATTSKPGLFQFNRSLTIEQGLPADTIIAIRNQGNEVLNSPVRLANSSAIPTAIASSEKTYATKKISIFSTQNLILAGILTLLIGAYFVTRFIRAENSLITKSQKNW